MAEIAEFVIPSVGNGQRASAELDAGKSSSTLFGRKIFGQKNLDRIHGVSVRVSSGRRQMNSPHTCHLTAIHFSAQKFFCPLLPSEARDNKLAGN